jgi:hypothetical protein
VLCWQFNHVIKDSISSSTSSPLIYWLFFFPFNLLALGLSQEGCCCPGITGLQSLLYEHGKDSQRSTERAMLLVFFIKIVFYKS